ncbi:MAG TPA: bacteriohemerythrin [Gammaproteobacteria bacterium]|nr:bacteriohemerythrin [Gammaproteobacteria bacterium]
MSLIDWHEEYSVGIASVDHEHREMINLINAVYDNLSSNASKDQIEAFLGEIYTKISAHFALEEKIMKAKAYDEYEGHKEDHERLLDEIRDIMDFYETDDYFSDKDLADQLERWFSEHFRTRDARLHKHLG